MNLLKIENLEVEIEKRVVISELNLTLAAGSVIAITGENGSGKSSLAMAMMGDSRFKIKDSSKIEFVGSDLLKMSVDERVRAGLLVVWQNPVVIPGVSVFSLCKASYAATGHKIEKLTEFKKHLEKLAVKVGLSPEYVGRSVNDGFSGGEKKRLELLQLLLLQPKLAVMDEIDSGVDQKGVDIIARVIKGLSQNGTGVMVITHNQRLIEKIGVDQKWEMKHGRLSTRV